MKKIALFILLIFGNLNVLATTCIESQALQSFPTIFYSDACGEESPDSTFFEPKIRVRIQNCNLISCISEEHSLKWDGQCVTTVGPYLLPLIRMCARVALPADTIGGKVADPGYTVGQHLDSEGATVEDKAYETSDGLTITPVVPKLCLYKDPSFLDTQSNESGGLEIDWFDTNPTKQPLHKTVGIHPVVEAIVFFIDNATTFTTSAFSMITSLFSMLGDEGSSDDSQEGGTEKKSNSDSGGGNASAFAVLADALSFVGDIITLLGTLITDKLKEMGQLNKVVDDKIYGCVNIPLGPYPPPYCETITPLSQQLTLQNICYSDKDGQPIQSLQGKECVVSTVRNNYINNSVRVGYDNFIPICKKEEDPMSTDKCVVIENLDSFGSAKGIHQATNRRDVIKPCATDSGSGICVRTMIPHKCSVSKDGCDVGFRLIYGVTIGSYTIPKPYFRDDLSDCPSTTGATCQSVWGINTGEFIDVSLKFEQNQEIYNVTPLSGTFSLTDNLDKVTNFTTSIVRIPEYNTLYSFNQDTKQFCVFKEDAVVGCKPRAPAPKISVYDCGSDNVTGLTCASDYFAPQFIAAYEAKYSTGEAETDFETDSTYALIAPETVTTSPINSKINLAGDNFEPFVTDYNFTIKPYLGPKSPEPNTIYGNYLDNVDPVVNGIPNPDAIYVDGIEYINGKYHLGGKFICLAPTDYTRCPIDPTICVLTKLLNTDTVRCSEFHKKFVAQQGLALCSMEQTSTCMQIDSMVKIGGGTVPIRSCEGENPGEIVKCYDGNVELCTISGALEDRISPSADLGGILSNSQYFNTTSSVISGGITGLFDSDIHFLRDKTAIERGYCGEVTPGICVEQTDYSEDNGFASWPETEVGDISIGICKTGYSASVPLERKCIPNPQTKTFYLEPLYRINGGVKTYTNVKCVEDPIIPPATP